MMLPVEVLAFCGVLRARDLRVERNLRNGAFARGSGAVGPVDGARRCQGTEAALHKPTAHGAVCRALAQASKLDVPGGVVSFQGFCFVPSLEWVAIRCLRHDDD
jgi:hypothetical protein